MSFDARRSMGLPEIFVRELEGVLFTKREGATRMPIAQPNDLATFARFAARSVRSRLVRIEAAAPMRELSGSGEVSTSWTWDLRSSRHEIKHVNARDR